MSATPTPKCVILTTGHRPGRFPNGYSEEFNGKLCNTAWAELRKYLQDNSLQACDCLGIVGMALGFDQAIAHAFSLAGVPFEAFVPCPGYEYRWPAASRARFTQLLAKAKAVRYTATHFHDSVLKQRNLDMVKRFQELSLEKPDHLLLFCFWDGRADSGTAHCMRSVWKAAENRDLELDQINIYSKMMNSQKGSNNE